MGCHKIWYKGVLQKSVSTSKILLKWENNKWYCTHAFLHGSQMKLLNIYWNGNALNKNCTEKVVHFPNLLLKFFIFILVDTKCDIHTCFVWGMSVMTPSVMINRIKYWDPSWNVSANLATWLMTGLKLVGPYSWICLMQVLYASSTPDIKPYHYITIVLLYECFILRELRYGLLGCATI